MRAIEKTKPNRRSMPPAAVLAVVALAAFSVLCGCRGSSPEAAVEQYFEAWSESDWELYRDSVLVNTKKPAVFDEDTAKQEFERIRLRAEGLEMETAYDKEDGDIAVATLVKGKITLTAKLLGKDKTETLDIATMESEDRPTFKLRKQGGKWYVDVAPELYVTEHQEP